MDSCSRAVNKLHEGLHVAGIELANVDVALDLGENPGFQARLSSLQGVCYLWMSCCGSGWDPVEVGGVYG